MTITGFDDIRRNGTGFNFGAVLFTFEEQPCAAHIIPSTVDGHLFVTTVWWEDKRLWFSPCPHPQLTDAQKSELVAAMQEHLFQNNEVK